MTTKDWKSVETPKVLLVGENPTLQWSPDEVIEYVMFLDYYFKPQPEDNGERSRFVEAESIFSCIRSLTGGKYKAEEIYGTNLCLYQLKRAPHGKRVLIPANKVDEGLDHIVKVLVDNPSIEVVFAASIQVNYWLQRLEFYGDKNETFIYGAQPRQVGIVSSRPYYQPVNAKVFEAVCGNVYEITHPALLERKVKIVPILPAKDFPLFDKSLEKFGDAYDRISEYFEGVEIE